MLIACLDFGWVEYATVGAWLLVALIVIEFAKHTPRDNP